jgi:hypothetical protein
LEPRGRRAQPKLGTPFTQACTGAVTSKVAGPSSAPVEKSASVSTPSRRAPAPGASPAPAACVWPRGDGRTRSEPLNRCYAWRINTWVL